MTEHRAKKDDYQKVLAVYGQGIKEFHKGDFEKAVELLKAFIEKYPLEREIVDRAQTYLAIALKRQKKEIVSLRNFEDYLRYGSAKINQGDFEGALKLLEKALEFKEKDGQVYFLMADACILMGQIDAALENLKKAIQKDKSLGTMAQNEADFAPLWDDKRFRLLTRLA